MLRIGIDASPLTRPNYTGTEWSLWNIITGVSKNPLHKEFDWNLYIPNKKITKKLFLPENWRIKILYSPVSRFWISGRLALEMILNKPDILFVPANSLPPIGGKKSITIIHDIGFIPHPEFYSEKERRALTTALKRAIKIANHIITPSAFTASELQKFMNVSKEQITVIPLGVDKNSFYNSSLASDEIINKNPYVLFVGRISLKKNLITLIKALKLVNAKRFLNAIFIGPMGFGGEKIVKSISDESLQNKIQVMPWQEEDVLKKYISNAEALILPSWYEGFGLTILEAQTLNTPVICSDIPPLEETAGSGALFFSPGSPRELANAIETILSSKETKEALKNMGMVNAASYSVERMAKGIMEIILRLQK